MNPIESTIKKSKFKFIFTDGNSIVKDATDYNQAAILACANRINSGKDVKIAASFAGDEKGKYSQINVPAVTINLKGNPI